MLTNHLFITHYLGQSYDQFFSCPNIVNLTSILSRRKSNSFEANLYWWSRFSTVTMTIKSNQLEQVSATANPQSFPETYLVSELPSIAIIIIIIIMIIIASLPPFGLNLSRRISSNNVSFRAIQGWPTGAIMFFFPRNKPCLRKTRERIHQTTTAPVWASSSWPCESKQPAQHSAATIAINLLTVSWM